MRDCNVCSVCSTARSGRTMLPVSKQGCCVATLFLPSGRHMLSRQGAGFAVLFTALGNKNYMGGVSPRPHKLEIKATFLLYPEKAAFLF